MYTHFSSMDVDSEYEQSDPKPDVVVRCKEEQVDPDDGDSQLARLATPAEAELDRLICDLTYLLSGLASTSPLDAWRGSVDVRVRRVRVPAEKKGRLRIEPKSEAEDREREGFAEMGSSTNPCKGFQVTMTFSFKVPLQLRLIVMSCG